MRALADAYERQQRALDALRASGDAPHLCPEATPVLFFGEIARARIVTAAINPSAREFVARDGAPLARPRLLHDRARSGSAPADAERALELMRSYFDPARDVVYWDWFRPVEHLLNALGASMVDASAASTNVRSCVATRESWSRTPVDVRTRLAEAWQPDFVVVLRSAAAMRTLVLLGPGAIDAFRAAFAVDLEPVETPYDGLPKCAPFRPVLARGAFAPAPGRSVQVLAVRPYRNLPTLPLSRTELTHVAEIARRADIAGARAAVGFA
jgi:hypothetical protein